MPDLRDHTTLRLGGPAKAWVRAETEAELIEAVSAADAAGEPVLVLGGGSNVVVADEGFAGTVVEVATRGITSDLDDDVDASCSGATVKVAAGEPWDPFVALAVERRWSGVEALAGIPGHVGATPIQNVGAYGQEVSQTIATRAGLGPQAPRGPYLRRRRLRLRLPHQPVQAGPRPPRRPRRHLPAAPRHLRRPAGVRRARPHPQPRGRPAGAHRVGARGRARPAHPQGHGPRPGRPRHLVGRLLLHQPGRRARRGAGVAPRPGRSPTAP